MIAPTGADFGARARPAVAGFYAGASILFAASFHAAGAGIFAYLALAAGAVQLGWQVASIDPAKPATSLTLFKSNRWFGWILFVGLLIDGYVL